MSFFAENKSRPRLALDGVMGEEPPHKRQRNILAPDLSFSDVGYGVGTALGFSRTSTAPLSIPPFGSRDGSFLGAPDSRAWPFRPGFDAKFLPLSASSLSGTSSAAAFIERHLPKLDPPLISAPINLGVSQAPVDPVPGSQLPGLTLVAQARTKTKLCKHFIEGNCKFKDNCNFAHSIEELKKSPNEGNQEVKVLLEKYRAKADAEKQSTVLTDSTKNTLTELKPKLCKYFIEGECKFKEGCHFAHSVDELKKLPDDGDDEGKSLLEKYKSKAEAQKPKAVLLASKFSEGKTKLCKHFISGNCKYKEVCAFAHSIEELKKGPLEGDDAGKALLEQYQAKAESEKPLSEPKQVVESESTKPDAPFKPGEDSETVKVQRDVTVGLTESVSDKNAEVEEKPNRLLKTKMCKHFLVGACKYMELCTFAHTIEELKPASDEKVVATKATSSMPPSTKGGTTSFMPPLTKVGTAASTEKAVDGKEVTVGAQSKDIAQVLHKMKPCRFFLEGACRFGDTCAFIHGKEQMPAVNSSGCASQSGVPEGYKTRLCNMWEKGEPCTFGSKCHFAHGLEELRQKGAPTSRSNSSVHGILDMEASVWAKQSGFTTSRPYSYDVTDTSWRPSRAAEEAWNGFGGGPMNERLLDLESSRLGHSSGLRPNYGQLGQASLASIEGSNLGLTSTSIFSNMPSWQTR